MKITLKALSFLIGVGLSASAFSAEVSIAVGSGKTISLTDTSLNGRQVQIAASSGTSHLEFSNGTGVPGGVPSITIGGAVGALNVFKAVPVAFDGTSVTEKTALYGTRVKTQKRYALYVDTSIGAVVINNVTNQIGQVTGLGSFTLNVPTTSNLAGGGLVNLKNIRIDLNLKRVIADVTSTPLVVNLLGQRVPGPSTLTTNVHMWDINSISGPTVIPVSGLLNKDVNIISALGWTPSPNGRGGYDITAKVALNGLSLTSVGQAQLLTAIGGGNSALARDTINTVNNTLEAWGSKEISIKLELPQQTCPI